MSTYKSDFLNVLNERGFIHQCSDFDGLDALLKKETVSAYVGYDATATSLHIGNLISVTMLYWLQETGHRPVTLMGGGTSMVGDPSFRDDQRKLLTPEQIDQNIEGIKKIFGRIMRYGDGPTDAMMVNNADWLMKLNYIEFLRDVGRHFSVNRMLSFDSVKLRLEREQSLSFLEFNYMILQAYDFVELQRKYGCVLQMGGSDQWGNIVNGVELGRRTDDSALFGLTVPLMTTASGAKMGKTASGAVWLNADRLSPYDYWQYWRNTEDADVGRFLKLFTDLPLDEIVRLESLDGAEINAAKIVLANEATRLCHGEDAARAAEETAHKTFAEGTIGDDLPTIDVTAVEIEAGIGVLEALTRAGLTQSNGDARRQIKGGAVRINDEKVDDDRRVLGTSDVSEGVIKLSLGKKKHALIRVA